MAEFLASSGPKETGMTPADYEAAFCNFLLERELPQVELLLLTSSSRAESKEHKSLYVHASTLVDYDPSLAFYAINYPKLILPLFDKAVVQAQRKIVSHPKLLEKYPDRLGTDLKPTSVVNRRNIYY